VKILVTAFGPFDGRSQNASSLALARLKQSQPRLNTRILPVDSVSGPTRLLRALKQVRPDVLVMLGEAAGSTAIRLETTAWNQLDFSIPDASGRQPRGVPIDPNGPDFLPATLPLEIMHAELTLAGHDAMLSHDAGRYLCNQVMYQSLAWLSKQESACVAGFVHLPLANHYPTSRAAQAIEILLDLIRQSRGSTR
jgi:pyroglutamyl-peptidase